MYESYHLWWRDVWNRFYRYEDVEDETLYEMVAMT